MLSAIFNTRAISSIPWSVNNDIGWGNWIGEPGEGGPYVDERSAASLMAVYGSATFITDEVATLPVNIDGGPRPAWVDEPMEGVDRIGWLGQIMWSLLLSGNAYLAVLGNQTKPNALEPLDPNKVQVVRQNGRRVVLVAGQPAPFPIVHIPGRMRPGDLIGMSPIEWARQSIGLGLSAAKYGAEFFGGEGNMPGVISAPHPMQPETMRDLAAQWQRKRSKGGRGLPGVLQNGATWHATGVTNEQAQFLATRKFTAAEIAGQMFLLDPSDLGIPVEGTSLTYANLEQRNTRRMQVALMPWIRRIESQLSDVLPQGVDYRFDVDSRLRGNTKESYDTLKVAVDAGFMSTDEVREILGLEAEQTTTDIESLVEMVRKLYLGVGVLMSPDEARAILNEAGANLGAGFVPTTTPTSAGRDSVGGAADRGGRFPGHLRHGGATHSTGTSQEVHGNWAKGIPESSVSFDFWRGPLDTPDNGLTAAGGPHEGGAFAFTNAEGELIDPGELDIAPAHKFFGAMAVAQQMTPDEIEALRAELNSIEVVDAISGKSDSPLYQLAHGARPPLGGRTALRLPPRAVYDLPLGVQLQAAAAARAANAGLLHSDQYNELVKLADFYRFDRHDFVPQSQADFDAGLDIDLTAANAHFSAELERITGVTVESGFVAAVNGQWQMSSQTIVSQAIQLEVAAQNGVPFEPIQIGVIGNEFVKNPNANPVFKAALTVEGSTAGYQTISAPKSMHWVSNYSLYKSTEFRDSFPNALSAVVAAHRRHSTNVIADFGPLANADSVTLYRGVKGLDAIVSMGDDSGYQLITNPLSSWTVDRDTAIGFAGQLGSGYVMVADIPVDQILTTSAWSGLGSLYEQEVIVMGDEDSRYEADAVLERSDREPIVINVDELASDWIKEVGIFRGGEPGEDRSTTEQLSTRHGGGSHDESTHGNWAHGGVAEKLAEALKDAGGFTYDTGTGEFVTTGIAVAHDRASYSEPLSALSIREAETWFVDPDSAKAHVRAFMARLGADGYDEDTKLGGWYDKPHGEVVLDAVKVFPKGQRAEAIEQGRLWNQQEIADLDALARGDNDNAFIDTGGSGGRSEQEPTSRRGAARGQADVVGPDGRRPRRDGRVVRDQDVRAGGQAAADVQGLTERHKPGGHDHNQKDHGNWAKNKAKKEQAIAQSGVALVWPWSGFSQGQPTNPIQAEYDALALAQGELVDVHGTGLTLGDLGVEGRAPTMMSDIDPMRPVFVQQLDPDDPTKLIVTVREIDPYDEPGAYSAEAQYQVEAMLNDDGEIMFVTASPFAGPTAMYEEEMAEAFDDLGIPVKVQGTLEGTTPRWPTTLYEPTPQETALSQLTETYNGVLDVGAGDTPSYLGDTLYLDEIRIESEVHQNTYDEDLFNIEGELIDEAGGVVARFERTINIANGTVHNDRFFMNPNAQGRGIGTAFLDRTESTLRDMGIEVVELQAVEVGKYAWAERGFALADTYRSNEALNYWTSVVRERLDNMHYGLPSRQADELEALLYEWESGYDEKYPYELVAIDPDLKDVLLDGPSWDGYRRL